MIRVIAANELRRRVRDRSIVIGCLVAPLLMAAVLGLSFAAGGASGPVRLGVSGASAQLVRAALNASQLPRQVTVEVMGDGAAVRAAVADGTLGAGVVLDVKKADTPRRVLIPVVAPGSTHEPGFDVITRSSSLLGQEYAESLAAGLSSQLFAGQLDGGRVIDPPRISIVSENLGHGQKGTLNFFAPNIAVVFLFIGSGLGMRSLLMERTQGTLTRIAVSPVRASRVVLGKLLAIFTTGLATIGVIWAVTTFVFGASWGDPGGVALMAVGATLAMCALGVFLTSLAKDEQQAFGIVLIVGLGLSLLGGNLLPSGSLPSLFQTLSLGTPNGWALVGFGRLAQLREPVSAAVDPFLVLLAIAAVMGLLAMTRVRRMVEP